MFYGGVWDTNKKCLEGKLILGTTVTCFLGGVMARTAIHRTAYSHLQTDPTWTTHVDSALAIVTAQILIKQMAAPASNG